MCILDKISFRFSGTRHTPLPEELSAGKADIFPE